MSELQFEQLLDQLRPFGHGLTNRYRPVCKQCQPFAISLRYAGTLTVTVAQSICTDLMEQEAELRQGQL